MRTQYTPKLTKDSKLFSSQTIALLPEADYKSGKWLSSLPSDARSRIEMAVERLREPLKAGQRLCVPGRTKDEEDFVLALLPKETQAYFLLEFARDTLKEALHSSISQLRILFLETGVADITAEAFGAALAARVFEMPVYGKREKELKAWKLKTIELMSPNRNVVDSFQYGRATGEGSNLARYLSTLPPNILNPRNYGERIHKLCKENGLAVRFYSKDELKKMGAGAFTAVDQGNPDSSGGIYELSYTPRAAKNRKRIHLVGKGMCFDTGGYDVKTGGHMQTMKGDMGGSAVALATLITASRLTLPLPMKAYLAITENHLSPKSYKADEVVTALNGMSIEVIDTDAEGRMVLSDTLTLASRDRPDCVIDFATLTGSAVRALGTRYSAGFTNRDELHEAIKSAGTNSGERVWTFPIDSSYAKSLESKIADISQCSKTPGPDHILAAYFLSKFLENETPWVHIDLAASENEGGIGHVDSLFTGFGVRWALEFIRKVYA